MSLFVWEVLEEGEWGTIAVSLPQNPERWMALQHHKREIIDRLWPAAEHHAHQSGLPIRLVRYEEAEVLQSYESSGGSR